MIKKCLILLATYNGEKYLQEQIDSILGQKDIEVSIFVSDDKSEDNTLKTILSYKDDRIFLLSSKNDVGSAAQNFFRLIRDTDITEYDYLCLSDQDDIWNASKLSHAISLLNTKKCDGYSSNVTAFWPDGREVLVIKSYPQQEWDFLFESPGPGCTFVLKKKLAIDLQDFLQKNQQKASSIWVHDWFIYAYARANHYNWYIDEKPSMLYRQHQNNEIGVNSGRKALLHRMKFILSGKAMEQSSLIASLCGLEANSFVKRWHQHSRLGMLFLAINAKKCRRKPSHRAYFILSCLLLFITGKKGL